MKFRVTLGPDLNCERSVGTHATTSSIDISPAEEGNPAKISLIRLRSTAGQNLQVELFEHVTSIIRVASSGLVRQSF